MKTGRNDPCPCGSGKKYKKCCLEKDENERTAMSAAANYRESYGEREVDEWKPEDVDEFEDRDRYIDDEDIDDSFEDDEQSEDEADDDPESDNEPVEDENFDDDSESEELPEISDEETKLVDDWWEAYKAMDDAVKEREHLVAFIDKYPHLTEHLELHWEVLFEIGAAHFEQGIYDTFIDLLMRIRNEFPKAYKKSYGYYDADIIYWLTAHGRLAEIDHYLAWFKENIGAGREKIYDIVEFLRALNHSDLLLPLADSSQRYYTDSIIGNRILSKYLDQEASEETARLLLDELRNSGIKLSGDNSVETWRNLLMLYKRPFVSWSNVLPEKRSEAIDYYFDIVENFTSYLYQNTELLLDSAKCYTDTVFEYYRSIVNSKKRPDDLFCLDIPTFKKHTVGSGWLSNWFIGGVEDIVRMNAFYHYSDYLRECGNITEEQKNKFQKFLSETYAEYYPKVEKDGPEMLSFKQFPLFPRKKKS